jgi:hypothetical protein
MCEIICKFLVLGLFFSFSTSSIASECESANNEISLSQIESIFQQMETQSKWNTKAKLLWGYFFFDADKAKLQKLSAQLANEGYREVELFFNDHTYTLHIEKAELHTPQTLFDRNNYFSSLAKKNCIKTYDGFDVGLYAKN